MVSKFIEAIKCFSQNAISPAKPTYDVFAVKFDPSVVTETVKADIRINVGLIECIPPEYFDRIYDAAVQAEIAGGDLNALSTAILHLNIDGMTKKRAKRIALTLNSKATTVITRERQQRLGITEAIWLYSGAPCDIDPKKPQGNQDASHKAANGKRFRVAEGMFLDGKWTWPGNEDGCRCVSRPVIPALDDGRYNKL
jgi:uncharacterized protein with gpF-like domain